MRRTFHDFRHPVLALAGLALSWCMGGVSLAGADEPGDVSEPLFPRCVLDASERDQFHERYGAGHLAMARGEARMAQVAFEDALRICVDDEILWFLSLVHEDMGQPEVAQRYRTSWLMQRRLHNLDETPPSQVAPRKSTSVHIPSLVLGSLSAPSRSGARPLLSIRLDGSYSQRGYEPAVGAPRDEVARAWRTSLELPYGAPGYVATRQSRRLELTPVPGAGERKLRRDIDVVATLDVTTTPAGARVRLDGVVLGTTPLSGVTIPAGKESVLSLEKEGYHPTTRKLYVAPNSNQRLYLSLRRE